MRAEAYKDYVRETNTVAGMEASGVSLTSLSINGMKREDLLLDQTENAKISPGIEAYLKNTVTKSMERPLMSLQSAKPQAFLHVPFWYFCQK
jgi:hypothetical protein